MSGYLLSIPRILKWKSACLYEINWLEDYWTDVYMVFCKLFRVVWRKFIAIEDYSLKFGFYVFFFLKSNYFCWSMGSRNEKLNCFFYNINRFAVRVSMVISENTSNHQLYLFTTQTTTKKTLFVWREIPS